MAHLMNEKSKAKATSKPSSATPNMGVPPTVLGTLRAVAVAGTSPIPALAQAANLAVQITTTVQVHLSTTNRRHEHIADLINDHVLVISFFASRKLRETKMALRC